MCFCVAVHASLKSIHDVLTLERERVRQAWTGPELRHNTSQQLATLCSTLSEVTHARIYAHTHMHTDTLAEAELGYVETKLTLLTLPKAENQMTTSPN